MKAHLIDTHLLVLRSRSSAKVNLKYQGHVSQKMGVSGALVFQKHFFFLNSILMHTDVTLSHFLWIDLVLSIIHGKCPRFHERNGTFFFFHLLSSFFKLKTSYKRNPLIVLFLSYTIWCYVQNHHYLQGTYNSLPHTPKFNHSAEEAIWNIVGKGVNAGEQHFLLFPQCFLTFHKQIQVCEPCFIWCQQMMVVLIRILS